jgi:hypothetical protein
VPWGDFEPDALLGALAGAGVDFVVVGGIAAVMHGSARITQDLDIAYAKTPENLTALGGTLIGLGARLRGIDEEVPFVPDAQTLRHVTLLTLDTKAGPLDLWGDPSGAPPYDELRRDAERITFESLAILVASIDHLVAMKTVAGRPKDIADIDELDAIRRLRRS